MRKIVKKFLSIVIVSAMLFSFYIPITRVFADGEYVLTFSISGNHVMENDNGHLKIDGQHVDLRDANDEEVNIGTVECNASVCTITVNNGTAGKLNYYSANKFSLFMQGHEVDMNFSFSANENILVQDYVEPQGGEEPGEEQHFDGHAYVLWSCDGGVCYHEFTDIPAFDDGRSTFYKDTDITADNDPSKHFDVFAEYKAWALPDRFNYWSLIYREQNNIDEIDWSEVNPEDIISEYPPNMGEWEKAAIDAGECVRPQEGDPREDWDAFEWCVDDYYVKAGNLPFIRLQPVGEPNAKNAYVSYGDRNFKVVIYNSEYKGITMGDLSELHYYPSSWANPFVMRDQFDISGTTKDKPALMDSILLESTVIIRALDVNNFEIKKIEALDVPDSAVEIEKTLKGDYKLIFSSNFYDNVVFKITDKNNQEYYLRVSRYTIDSWIKMEDNHPVLTADFYFDREKSYTDFDITAKIIYKDGTTKNVKLTVSEFGIDDGLGNITHAYEVDEQTPEFGPS